MRSIITHICKAGLGVGLALALGSASAQEIKVGVTSIVEHPALDAARDGVKQALEEAGYKDGENYQFLFQSAQNRQPTAVQIAQKYVGDKVNVIVAIGTPSAQAAANATKDIPVLFSAITDPVAAGLMQELDRPDANVTGVSDMTPIADHVSLIRELLPQATKIGYLYNPSEANSVAALRILQQAAKPQGFEIIESTALQTAQVRNATLALVDKVDVIYITTDNTVVSALETAIMVANENKVPFVAADPESAVRGALVAAGVNYFDIGLLTGAMVVQLLKGEKVANIPAEIAPANDLYINKKTAEAIGYSFPNSITQRATRIIE